jgi:hypothetical protein
MMEKSRAILQKVFLTLGVIVLWGVPLIRADVYGVILGTVKDPSGALVPGAKVVLQNKHTGLVREATTDATGNYEFLAVPVGEDYEVAVAAGGFQRSAQSGIKLLVDQRFRADFQLEVGAVTQEVSVSANLAQVETVSTQLGDVIQDKKMEDLPLNGRSYLDLMGLQAGVVPVNTTGGGQPISGNITGGLLSVNGQREDSNLFMVNGSNVEEVGNNGTSILPTLDSIQEFRLLTNSFDAEYGNFSGAIMNAVTKSGTNSWHGTAFEFVRNQKLDSRNFFDYNQINPITGEELPNTAIGVFRRNQFGGVLGGPILKDRLFFFVDYQGTRESRAASTGVVPVPSVREDGGDFSDVSATGYKPLTGTVRGDNNPADGAMPSVLSQRLGYTVNPNEPYWAPGCTTQANAQAGMCVFPNQIIPPSAFSPAAKGLLRFMPAPSATLSNGEPFFSSSAYPATTRDDKFAPRIDLVNKLTGNWSFYYHFDNATVVNPYASANIPGFTATRPSRAQQINLSNTRTLSSSAVNEFRANFVRVAYPGNLPSGGVGNVSSFGFQNTGLGLLQQNPAVAGVPSINLNQLGVSFGAAMPSGLDQNTYSLQDNFSKIIGKHTLKFGGLFGYSQWNLLGGGSLDGVFGFNGTETGNDFADFLLGAPDTFHQDNQVWIESRVKTTGIYAQDSFRWKSDLTVNYGVRWELGEPWYDAKNRLQAFVPGEQSTHYLNSPEGWVYPLDPRVVRTIAPTQLHDFAPRLGIAYSPSATDGFLGKLFGGPGKTSIRAAAGMFYTSFSTSWQGWEAGDAPFSNYYVSPTLIYLEEPFKSRLSGNNPGQRFPIPPLAPSESFASFQPIGGASGYQLTNVTPYAEDFNFTVQREIAKSTVVTLGYVGTRGHHLFSQVSANPGNAAKCLQILALYTAAGQPTSGCGPFGEDNIYSIGGQTFNGTRPYSVTSGRYLSQGTLDFSDISWEMTMGNSNYNALQLTVNKQMGRFRFLGAYTYSKSLDDASAFGDLINPFNYKLSKALSLFDMTHNFVISYSYELPFDRLTRSRSGVLYKALSGWEFAGITRLSTGTPVSLMESDDQSLCGCFALGPSAIDFPNYDNQPLEHYNPRSSSGYQQFSTTQFSQEQLGVPGDASRRFFHGPGLNNWDVSLFKNVSFNERLSLDIRAEFFNAFNHAQFGLPVGNFTASNFGDITSANSPRIGQVAMKLHF